MTPGISAAQQPTHHTYHVQNVKEVSYKEVIELPAASEDTEECPARSSRRQSGNRVKAGEPHRPNSVLLELAARAVLWIYHTTINPEDLVDHPAIEQPFQLKLSAGFPNLLEFANPLNEPAPEPESITQFQGRQRRDCYEHDIAGYLEEQGQRNDHVRVRPYHDGIGKDRPKPAHI